ncbi:MAG: VanZ family protein [Candidatus Hydrogenedentes bacterium]|nr:VanZ family protein [Candidatus Hydrogenedentota bacterium]
MIFLLSSQSDPRAADWGFLAFPGADKLVHGLLYAGLAAVVSVGVWRSNETIRASLHFWIPITFAVIYGFSDEVHQIYVPERTFDWMDLLADGVGATIVQAALCGYLWTAAARRTRAAALRGE